jgi:lysophosphatidate acyltransferase
MHLTTVFYLVIISVALRYLFTKSSLVRYITRQLIYNILLLTSALIGLLSLLLLVPLGLGHKANQFVGRTLDVLCTHILHIKLEVTGSQHLESVRPCVFLMNHQSNMDMRVMGGLLPTRAFILAKQEILRIPLIGQFFHFAKNMIIDRGDRKAAIDTMGVVAERLQEQKVSLWIYPEGTRSYQSDRSLLPFKKGAFHLAVKGKMPVIPVIVSTYSPMYDEKTYAFEPCTIHVTVLEPVFSDNVDELMQISYDKMLETLKEIETTGVDSGSQMKNK